MENHMQTAHQNSKKILIATGIYPPSIGGPATYSFLLNQELPKHGFNVDVLTFDSVRHLPKGLSHLSFLWKLFGRFRKADIVYVMDTVSVGLPVLICSLILRRKYILRVAGDYAWEQGQARFGVRDDLDSFSLKKSGYGWRVAILKNVQNMVATRASKIIVPSFYLKRIVCNWGIDRFKVFVVQNCVEPVGQLAEKEMLRKKLGFTGRVMISVGRLVRWKGFGTLIDSMPDLLAVFPDLSLFIVGDGPQKKELEQKVTHLGLANSVFLVGKKPRNDLMEYIKAADVFALNTFYEGLSHQVLEVMQLDTPVITTDVGGNTEVIQDGVDGLLIAYNDMAALKRHVMRVFSNGALRDRIVAHAREKVKKFNKERMLTELIKELE